MDLSEVEERLLELLASPQISADAHLRALSAVTPTDMADVAAIGLDTNILKALRREPTFADSLFVTLQSTKTALIAPGQCVIEYWNNHKVFASDEWNSFKNNLDKLTRHLDSDGVDIHNTETVSQIHKLVDELTADLDESRSPVFLAKSRALMAQLLETATVPTVSRTRFGPLGTVRLANKTPPGWEDDRTKSAALGDYFAWCDFMLGVMCSHDPQSRNSYVYVTDETKPDWRAGTAPHPSLVAEFSRVCGGELSLLTLAELRKLLTADARSKPPSADEDPHDATR